MCFLNLSLRTAAAARAFPCFHFTKCNNNVPMERGVTTIAWNNYCWRFRSHRSALIFQTHKRRDMCTTRWEMENKFLNEFTRAHTKESTHLSEFNCRPRNDRDRHFPILRTDVNRCSSLLSSKSKGKRRLEKSSSDLWGDFPFKFYEFLIFHSWWLFSVSQPLEFWLILSTLHVLLGVFIFNAQLNIAEIDIFYYLDHE